MLIKCFNMNSTSNHQQIIASPGELHYCIRLPAREFQLKVSDPLECYMDTEKDERLHPQWLSR